MVLLEAVPARHTGGWKRELLAGWEGRWHGMALGSHEMHNFGNLDLA
jgi:hypothetical protein